MRSNSVQCVQAEALSDHGPLHSVVHIVYEAVEEALHNNEVI